MTLTQQRPRTGPVMLAASSNRAVSAEASVGMPVVLNLDDGDSHADVLDALILSNFVNGSQPFAQAKKLDSVREEATLLPPGVRPTRSSVIDGQRSHLAAGEGWTLHAVRWNSGGGVVTVTAVSDELARSVLAQAIDGAAAQPEPEDERVEIGFWHLTGHGPRRRARLIAAPPWAEIRRNYSASATAALDQLIALDGTDLSGRVLLVHGPPGTGKTTALRALAREWRGWCQLDFVLDPERLFSEPGYLIEVVTHGSDDDDPPWHLLLLEDCDELIRSEAKQSTGQALSRLLNLTDGLLGQGRQILVAITTNEDIAYLHPAVTRPGRCLGQIEVGPMSHEEAVAWLGPDAPAPSGTQVTLAQLLALRDGKGPVTTPTTAPRDGLYL